MSDALDKTRRAATEPTATRRQRRAAAKALPALTAKMEAADKQWAAVGEPEAAALRRDIWMADRQLRHLSDQADREQLGITRAHRRECVAGLDGGLGL